MRFAKKLGNRARRCRSPGRKRGENRGPFSSGNHIRDLQQQLRRDSGGRKVDIRLKGKESGRLIVHFCSNDEFERVVGFLKEEPRESFSIPRRHSPRRGVSRAPARPDIGRADRRLGPFTLKRNGDRFGMLVRRLFSRARFRGRTAAARSASGWSISLLPKKSRRTRWAAEVSRRNCDRRAFRRRRRAISTTWRPKGRIAGRCGLRARIGRMADDGGHRRTGSGEGHRGSWNGRQMFL